jgi:hypothetical protein
MAYPIVFFGVRDSVMDIFEVPIADQTPENRMHTYLTMILLGTLTVTAMFVTDLGLINAVGGGTFECLFYGFVTCLYSACYSARDGYRFSHIFIIGCNYLCNPGLVTTPIVFLFPTIMLRRALKYMSTEQTSSWKKEVEILGATGLTCIGLVIGLSGAWIAVQSALTPSS